MNLIQKILALYPELEAKDFIKKIVVQDDGNGPYIKEWNHPTLAQPTQEQLDGISA